MKLRFHVSGEDEFAQNNATETTIDMSSDPMNDRINWVAEYERLCQLFREHWESDGMRQIVRAIHAVAFSGAEASTALQDAAVHGDALAVNERNNRATAGFGAAIPADLCKSSIIFKHKC